jgi:hypothetical protein
VWALACAIAKHAHPNAIYPQPADVTLAGALIVMIDRRRGSR